MQSLRRAARTIPQVIGPFIPIEPAFIQGLELESPPNLPARQYVSHFFPHISTVFMHILHTDSPKRSKYDTRYTARFLRPYQALMSKYDSQLSMTPWAWASWRPSYVVDISSIPLAYLPVSLNTQATKVMPGTLQHFVSMRIVTYPQLRTTRTPPLSTTS